MWISVLRWTPEFPGYSGKAEDLFKSYCTVKFGKIMINYQPKSTFATLCPDKATPRSDRAKSQWASPLSHFLKRPLVIISDMHCNLYIVQITVSIMYIYFMYSYYMSIEYLYRRNIACTVSVCPNFPQAWESNAESYFSPSCPGAYERRRQAPGATFCALDSLIPSCWWFQWSGTSPTKGWFL